MNALAYFITFHTYGSWLHGREAGSVDRDHNQYGTEFLPANSGLEQARRQQMIHEPYLLNPADREIVLASICQHCEYRKWLLYAAHVRSNHVHVVAASTKSVEQTMTEFKAYATRSLVAAHPQEAKRKRWSRHGSTRYVFDDKGLEAVVRYVIEGQGEAMAVYCRPPLPSGRGSEISHRTDNPSRDASDQNRDASAAAP